MLRPKTNKDCISYDEYQMNRIIQEIWELREDEVHKYEEDGKVEEQIDMQVPGVEIRSATMVVIIGDEVEMKTKAT